MNNKLNHLSYGWLARQLRKSDLIQVFLFGLRWEEKAEPHANQNLANSFPFLIFVI